MNLSRSATLMTKGISRHADKNSICFLKTPPSAKAERASSHADRHKRA